jgi:hypothetical protein
MGSVAKPAQKRCKKCGSVYEIHSEKTRQCTVCLIVNRTNGNAKKKRRDGTSPGIFFTVTQFAVWYAENPPSQCTYCEVPEWIYAKLGFKTQVGHQCRRLGLDRVDNSQGYTLENIVWACYPCNATHSNRYSFDEMLLCMGPGLKKVWETRYSLYLLENPAERLVAADKVKDLYTVSPLLLSAA